MVDFVAVAIPSNPIPFKLSECTVRLEFAICYPEQFVAT